MALSGVLWGFHLVRLNTGTVFSGWDTLFSWNAYAEKWASGRVPDIGGMYPQLVPANWSLSYLLQGKDAVYFCGLDLEEDTGDQQLAWLEAHRPPRGFSAPGKRLFLCRRYRPLHDEKTDGRPAL